MGFLREADSGGGKKGSSVFFFKRGAVIGCVAGRGEQHICESVGRLVVFFLAGIYFDRSNRTTLQSRRGRCVVFSFFSLKSVFISLRATALSCVFAFIITVIISISFVFLLLHLLVYFAFRWASQKSSQGKRREKENRSFLVTCCWKRLARGAEEKRQRSEQADLTQGGTKVDSADRLF